MNRRLAQFRENVSKINIGGDGNPLRINRLAGSARPPPAHFPRTRPISPLTRRCVHTGEFSCHIQNMNIKINTLRLFIT